ncbi:unnamed protein product [Boreogadus saida]
MVALRAGKLGHMSHLHTVVATLPQTSDISPLSPLAIFSAWRRVLLRAFKESKEPEKEGSHYFDKLGGALFTMISSFK